MRLRFFVACWLLPMAVSAQERLGPEFRVNTSTTWTQGDAAVAMAADGRFVVSWIQNGYDAIVARQFDASGSPEGSEIVISSLAVPNVPSYALEAAIGPSGAFIVAWDTGVAQTCDSSGALAGPAIVNAGRYPAAASVGAGTFVLTSTGADADSGGIVGRLIDGSGSPLAPEFAVNTTTTSYQGFPAVASAPSGRFAVAWETVASTFPHFTDLYVRLLDSAGQPLGPEMPVNEHTTGFQYRADVAMDASGNFVVVWEEDTQGQDTHSDASDIYAQRYDATGAPIGGNFRVNSITTGFQRFPAVASDANGTFLVVWHWFTDVFGRRFDASGNPMGPDFLVNSHTTGVQAYATVAGAGDGRFVVAWHNWINDTPSAPDVYAQMFLDGNLIFEDGFESGDHAAWSSSGFTAGGVSGSGPMMPGGGSFSLVAWVSAPGGSYVQDDTPGDEPEYHARFYFDPNGFDPGEDEGHLRTRLFLGFQGAPSRRLMAVVLRRQGGAYSLRGRARLDDNSQADTAFVPITDEPHAVEVAWRRSSGPDATDGWFEMWIDGESAGRLSGLDNGAGGVDFVRLGALSVKSGASGSMYFDQFDSRREGSIGP